ncbi:MAG: heme ABC exporter ATP-binding protein CcmA [Candidatus Krumholzibacteria bacterium]|nr:heme ABC exporter ATP-binding protein CcmA [Candidatus Krumholzibacteria bacterium]
MRSGSTVADAATAPALSCEHVTKRFGRLTALRSVDLTVRPGECTVLFGRNGAGKSTLLHIVAALIRSYEGRVAVFGEDLRAGGERSRRALGLVSHDSYLYNDLTALDNLRFYARLYGARDAEARARALLARFDLEAKARSTVRELSRGMKQRLSLARAVLHEPRLLLLDEPFTGLDEPACATLAGMLGEFVAHGGAALLTTHDVERGLEVAQRVAVLERGAIAFEAPAAGLDAAAFRHRYRELLEG